MKPAVTCALLGMGLCQFANAQGETNGSLGTAIREGSANLDLRYRYEYVDDNNFDKRARASLLRSRLSLRSAPIAGFSALLEIDNVTSIGVDDYNSTENGKPEFPTVSDPEGTEINQAWLGYSDDKLSATAGRQRILLGEMRFVGAKPWRNNEQTYDGARLQWSGLPALSVDASYVYQVNRAFGPADGANPADWRGDSFFLRSEYRLTPAHTLSAFAYWLDVDEQRGFDPGKTSNNSSDSYGVEYRGTFAELDLRASWAWQTDAGKSELDYQAQYYVVELGTRQFGLDIKTAYEVLAANNGVGFATPLANGHRYQGWADKFLATPQDGIKDAWISASGKLGPVALTGRYHDFRAESSGVHFGTEIDLQAGWAVTKNLTATFKAALFDSRTPTRYPDTNKFWLMLQFKL